MKKATGEIPLIIIGNKIDLAPEERRVNIEEAKDLAVRLGAKYVETSAKDGINVNKMFMEIALSCYGNAKKIEKELEEN